MNDHRRQQRYPIRISAELSTSIGPRTCLTRDLSLGGMGVEAEFALDEGAPVAFELFVVVDDVEDEATRPLQVDGRVAWCRRRGPLDFLAGIEFLGLSAEQHSYLQQLILAAKG